MREDSRISHQILDPTGEIMELPLIAITEVGEAEGGAGWESGEGESFKELSFEHSVFKLLDF